MRKILGIPLTAVLVACFLEPRGRLVNPQLRYVSSADTMKAGHALVLSARVDDEDIAEVEEGDFLHVSVEGTEVVLRAEHCSDDVGLFDCGKIGVGLERGYDPAILEHRLGELGVGIIQTIELRSIESEIAFLYSTVYPAPDLLRLIEGLSEIRYTEILHFGMIATARGVNPNYQIHGGLLTTRGESSGNFLRVTPGQNIQIEYQQPDGSRLVQEVVVVE